MWMGYNHKHLDIQDIAYLLITLKIIGGKFLRLSWEVADNT